jgi:hypothetical protein
MSNQAQKTPEVGEISKNKELNTLCRKLQKRLDSPFKLSVLSAHLLEDIQFKTCQTCPNTQLSPAKALADIIFLEHVASLPVVHHTRNILRSWIASKSAQTVSTEFVQCRELDTINDVLDEMQGSIQEAKKTARFHYATWEIMYTHCDEVSEQIIKGMIELRKKLGERTLKCCQAGTCKPRVVDKTTAGTPKREPEASVAKLKETDTESSSGVQAKTEPTAEKKAIE